MPGRARGAQRPTACEGSECKWVDGSEKISASLSIGKVAPDLWRSRPEAGDWQSGDWRSGEVS